MKNKEPSLVFISLSLFGFILLWAVVTDAWGYSSLLFPNMAGEGGSYLYGCLSRVIWVLPAVILVLHYREGLSWRFGELFGAPKMNRSLLFVLGLSTGYGFIVMLVFHGGFWFNANNGQAGAVMKLVMVGLVEELVFRGWGYNALRQKVSERMAVALSTGFFVALHWPAYLIRWGLFGTLDLSGLLSQSAAALVWGVIGCYLLRKGKTLWNPILAHTFYDLLFALLVA